MIKHLVIGMTISNAMPYGTPNRLRTLEGPDQRLWIEYWLGCGARSTVRRRSSVSQFVYEVSSDEVFGRKVLL